MHSQPHWRHRLGLSLVAGLLAAMNPAHAAEGSAALELLPAPVPPPKQVTTNPNVPPGMTLIADLPYGEHGAANLLDLYLPEKMEGPVPLVVWVHGGGWAKGDKTASPELKQLMTNGYAVASINYRLSGAAPFPAQIHDCKGAIRWLRAHAHKYHYDPNRIGVWGISAGGHLAALLGTSGDVPEIEGTVGGNAGVSSRVHAVSDYAGPTDLQQYWAQADEHNVFKKNNNRPNNYFDKLFGPGLLEDHADLVRLANPITFLQADAPPFQIFHGDKDVIVPIGQAEVLVAALQAKGVPCDYTVLKGAGHGFGQSQYRATIAFFGKILKPTAPAPAPPK